MRTVFIENLHNGQTVSEVWAVGKCDERCSVNGNDYLCFEFVDRTGAIQGSYWNPTPEQRDASCDLEFALVHGKITKPFGIKLSHFPQRVETPEDLIPYLRVSPVLLPELTRRFNALKIQVKETQLAALLEKLLGEAGRFRAQFWEAPAAIRYHHAFRHGLLQHSVEVAELALATYDACSGPHPNPFRRDLLITGALLHDIGKIREIKNDTASYDFSLIGNLLGHTTIGVATVSALVGQAVASPLRELLLHLVASHHGKYEWGAPALPQIREAFLLHSADALSVSLYYADAAQTKASPSDIKRGFVEAALLPAKRVFVGDYGFASPQTVSDTPIELWRMVCPWQSGETVGICAEAANSFATVRLPLLARASAGPGVYSEADVQAHFAVAAWAEGVSETSHYLLHVSGDSMTRAGICDGDRLVVQAVRQAEHGDIVVAALPDGAVTIKRLDKTKGACLFAESTSPIYPSPFVPHGTDFSVQGVARGVLRPTH